MRSGQQGATALGGAREALGFRGPLFSEVEDLEVDSGDSLASCVRSVCSVPRTVWRLLMSTLQVVGVWISPARLPWDTAADRAVRT